MTPQPAQIVQFIPASELKPMFDALAAEMHRENEFPEIMNITLVAKYCDVSEQTIRNRIKDSGFPVSERLGDKRFIKRDVDAWLRGQI